MIPNWLYIQFEVFFEKRFLRILTFHVCPRPTFAFNVSCYLWKLPVRSHWCLLYLMHPREEELTEGALEATAKPSFSTMGVALPQEICAGSLRKRRRSRSRSSSTSSDHGEARSRSHSGRSNQNIKNSVATPKARKEGGNKIRVSDKSDSKLPKSASIIYHDSRLILPLARRGIPVPSKDL